MPYLTLPDDMSPSVTNIRYVSKNAIGEPVFQGRSIRVTRPGAKFEVDFSLPPMKTFDDARIIRRRLIAGLSEPLKMRFPHNENFTYMPGQSPTVNGAGQEGTTLNVSGLYPNMYVLEGRYISVANGDDSHLHMVTAKAQADGNGDIALNIEPPLHSPTVDASSVEFQRPYFVGYIVGEDFTWREDVSQFTSLQFTVREL